MQAREASASILLEILHNLSSGASPNLPMFTHMEIAFLLSWDFLRGSVICSDLTSIASTSMMIISSLYVAIQQIFCNLALFVDYTLIAHPFRCCET